MFKCTGVQRSREGSFLPIKATYIIRNGGRTLIILKGYSASMFPWADRYPSRFPWPRGSLHRSSQEHRPQKPCEIPVGARRAHLDLLLWEKQCSATACKGTPQCPRHDLAVAVDMSILQLLYSHNWGKLPHEYSQGLLLSCKKNVTRKQPRSQNAVIFSLSLFSSVSESLLQKALLKHCHYSWPINQTPTFSVYIDLIYQTSWQN